MDFQENNEDFSNLDPVGFLNPAIGKSGNPRWKNKVYPESSCTKKFVISPAERKPENKLKREFEENDDLKYGWTYALPMHQVLKQELKPVSKPKIQFLREIKFKLSGDEKNSKTNSTEEREHDAVTDLPQSMQPLYRTNLANTDPTTGLAAHTMSHIRDNEPKHQEESSDA